MNHLSFWFVAICSTILSNLTPVEAQSLPKAEKFWNVDDVRAGMKGQGKTVIKGIRIEPFEAEVLGVMRNTSPGRDLILCKLSGANLEKTGVIAGMSGSPIYIEGKLLGAVSYAWPYGKEPIAGVTPFVQMAEFVAAYERRELAEKDRPRRVGLSTPIRVEGKSYDSVTVAHDFSVPTAIASDGLWLLPLRTPMMASGMSSRSLALLRDEFNQFGMVPMQGGGVGSNVSAEERNIPLEAGGALTVAMITGDFDLSGIGTVTHIEGKRVYGWGHPFMSLGGCDLPLMTGYVHTIYPRLSLSFKMGSPLRSVGVISADVSTCIAGWLDREPDMLPIRINVLREPIGQGRTFKVKVIRQRNLLGSLVQSALMNSLDMEGDAPEEMTAKLNVRIEMEGREPLILNDIYSGPTFSGTRGLQAMFMPVGTLLNQITSNPFEGVRIQRIEATIEIRPDRTSAEIESTELEKDTLAPGETLRTTVYLRPYKGIRQRINLSLPLPGDLPEGSYTALVGDDFNNVRADLRDNPYLANPQTVDHLFESLNRILDAKHTNLVLRVATQANGVAMNGKTLPNLPPSMVQLMNSSRRTGTLPLGSAIVVRQETGYVIQGAESLRFHVAKNKRLSSE